MKKKIAVFATGWISQLLRDYIYGLSQGLHESGVDIYLFLNFSSLGDSPEFQQGELNICNLPNIADFDVVYILANALDYPQLLEKINKKCAAAGVPVVYTGRDDGRHIYVGAENYSGAYELCEHIVSVHGIRDIFFVAGSKDNMDSNDRLRALTDVCSAKNISFDPANILYTDWDPTTIIMYIRNWVSSGRKLPEAFVCANDMLAMMVCMELKSANISVPDQILVTGFDNDFLAQVYDPSISSVSQRFDKVGLTCADVYTKLMNGSEVPRKQVINCEFFPSESCGCVHAKDFDALRREVGRNAFLDRMNNSAFSRKLSLLERSILQSTKYSELIQNLEQLINSYNAYEGESFHLILDPLLEQTIYDRSKQLRTEGYPERMNVLISKDDKELRSFDDFDTREIVPTIAHPEQSNFFICLPLHENGKSLGYLVFGNDFEKLSDGESIQKYQERLSIILSKYIQTLSIEHLNQRLTYLSETDILTHVGNRTAYQSKVNLFNCNIDAHTIHDFGIVLFDINNLKGVNDSLGHDAGDQYIVNCCRLICDCFKHSRIYRIGGDEFTILLDGSDFDCRHEILAAFNTQIYKLREMDLPAYEAPSIAYGLAEYNPDSDTCVSDIMRRADKLMYECKVRMKTGL